MWNQNSSSFLGNLPEAVPASFLPAKRFKERGKVCPTALRSNTVSLCPQQAVTLAVNTQIHHPSSDSRTFVAESVPKAFNRAAC